MELSTWELIRASGLTSFLLLFLSIMGGLLLSIKIASAKINKFLQIFHQSSGWFSFLFGLFHGLLLYIDDYQTYTLMEIFIPFMAKEHAILNGIGTISLYILILLFLSVDFMKKISMKLWKIIHRLSFPCFVFICLHGMLLGTDTTELWAILLYTSSIVMILSFLTVKLLMPKSKRNTKVVGA